MVAGLVGRKADAFAALLEGDPSAAASVDPAMAKMADIAQRLSSVPQPTAAFRSSLRDQLMATAGQTATPAAPHAAAPTHTPAQAPATNTPTVPTPRVSPGHGLTTGSSAGTSGTTGTTGLTSSFGSGLAGLGKTAPIWAKVFAGVAAVSVSATGVAVGADRALPGDLFYGVKKQVEAVQLDLASGAHGKAIAQLNFARARIKELNELIKRDHVVAGKPVSKETAGHLKELLENWAENAGVGTTSLIQQIQALGSSKFTVARSLELRKQLDFFSTQQFAAIGKLLGDMPTSSLQSLTVSALGYLQRVDRVLGNDPAGLIGKLPVSLNSIPGVSRVLPRLVLPTNIPTKNGKVVLPGPSALTSLLPTGGAGLTSVAPGVLPTTIPTISLPSAGGVTLPPVAGVTLPPGGSLPSIVSILPPLPGVIGQVPGAASSSSPGSGTVPSLPAVVPSAAQSLGGVVQSAAASIGAKINSSVPNAAKSLGPAVQSVGGGVTKAVPDAVRSGGAAASSAGPTATGAVQGATSALGSITGGLTSTAGPSLPLPTSLPVLPKLPKVPGLN